jgi:prefoldin subunit 5
MTAATDTDIREIKDLIQALDKKIEGLDKKVEIGFANIDTKFAKLEGKIDTVEAKIDKLDERTKLGFWGFIFRRTPPAALVALTAIFVKCLFPILPIAIQK